MTILDTVTQRLNGMDQKLAQTDGKVGNEATVREAQVASLQNRVFTLEVHRDSMGSELTLLNAKVDSLSARIDALLAQLTELGVQQ